MGHRQTTTAWQEKPLNQRHHIGHTVAPRIFRTYLRLSRRWNLEGTHPQTRITDVYTDTRIQELAENSGWNRTWNRSEGP